MIKSKASIDSTEAQDRAQKEIKKASALCREYNTQLVDIENEIIKIRQCKIPSRTDKKRGIELLRKYRRIRRELAAHRKVEASCQSMLHALTEARTQRQLIELAALTARTLRATPGLSPVKASIIKERIAGYENDAAETLDALAEIGTPMSTTHEEEISFDEFMHETEDLNVQEHEYPVARQQQIVEEDEEEEPETELQPLITVDG